MDYTELARGTIIETDANTVNGVFTTRFKKIAKGWRADSGHIFDEPYGQNPRQVTEFKMINPPQEFYGSDGMLNSRKALKKWQASQGEK